MAKYQISTIGLAGIPKPVAGPKTEPHLLTPNELAKQVKVYFDAPTKNRPVQVLVLGIGGRIVPFAFFSDNGTATNRTAQIPAGYEDSPENRMELASAYADAYLASPEIQEQVRVHLTARYFRLQDEKKAKEKQALGSKVAKANLAAKFSKG